MSVHIVATIDDLLALTDDGLRHELLAGTHVVTPAPSLRHQSVLAESFVELSRTLAPSPGLKVLWSAADIALGPDTLVQPDVFVVNVPTAVGDAAWSAVGVPLLVVEALSPSTSARDRGIKRTLYLAAGVTEYWVVDIDARAIERWSRSAMHAEIVRDHIAVPMIDAPNGIAVQCVFDPALN